MIGEIGKLGGVIFRGQNIADYHRQTYVTTSFKVDTLMLTKTMEIFMSEIDPVRNFKGILPALVLQVLSKEEISHFSKNGGNSLGITEDDGPLSRKLLISCLVLLFIYHHQLIIYNTHSYPDCYFMALRGR
jgi:hypothetical protein